MVTKSKKKNGSAATLTEMHITHNCNLKLEMLNSSPLNYSQISHIFEKLQIN